MNELRKTVTVYQDRHIQDYSDRKKIEEMVNAAFLGCIEKTYGHRISEQYSCRVQKWLSSQILCMK